MPNTYYDSELTGEQIEAALEAIHGVVTPENNGKVLAIEDGAIVAKSASEWTDTPVLEPLSVTANGDYTPGTGVDGYNSVHVAVPGAGNIQPLSVTQNGTYTPPSGVDGYAPVTVNVSGGGGDDWTDLKNYIESNGTQYINTGYSVKDNSKFEVIANPSTVQPQYGTIFGTRSQSTDYSNSQSCILAAAWDSVLGNVNWGSGINRLTSEDKGHKTKYFVTKSRGMAMSSESIEGIIGFVPINSTQSATSASLMLFTLGQNGTDYGSVTHCNMKLYRFRIYEGDTLVHEYLPWQENGVACLKDTVTSDLLYNAGTGDFAYGTDT